MAGSMKKHLKKKRKENEEKTENEQKGPWSKKN
jgi:hypothetical protein